MADIASLIAQSHAMNHAPLHQALAPMAGTQQGPGGSFGASPFAYLPPPLPPPPIAVNTAFQGGFRPDMSGMGAMGTAWRGMGQPGNPLNPFNFFKPSPLLQNPTSAAYGMDEFSMRAGNAPLGAAGGAMRMGLGIMGGHVAIGAGMAGLRALPQAGAHLAAGGFRAMGATGLMGAAGSLASGAWGAGMTMAGAMAPFALPGAALAAAGGALSYGLGGAAQFGRTHGAANDIFGGMRTLPGAGITGRGMGVQDVAGLTSAMRAMSNTPFKRFEDSMRSFETLAGSGLLTRNARTGKDIQRNFEQAFKTIGDLADAVNVTMKQANDMFLKIQSMGIGGRQGSLRAALNARTQAGVIGVSVDQLLETGMTGAQMARQRGMFGAGGAAAATGLATAISSGFQAGTVSQQQLMDVTGGAADPLMAAQAMQGKIMDFLGGQGQFLVAAAMDGKGGINKQFLSDMTAGKIGIDSALSRGSSMLSGSPQAAANFTLNKQKLTSEFLEGLGADTPAAIYQMLRRSAADKLPSLSAESGAAAIGQSQMGLTEAEMGMLSGIGGPGAVAERRRREAASARSGAFDSRLKRATFGGQWETSLAGLREWASPMQEIAQGVKAGVAGAAQGFFGGMYGAVEAGQSETYSPAVRASLMGRGSAGGSSRTAEETFGRGLNNIYGAAGSYLNFKTTEDFRGTIGKASPLGYTAAGASMSGFDGPLVGSRWDRVRGAMGKTAGMEFGQQQKDLYSAYADGRDKFAVSAGLREDILLAKEGNKYLAQLVSKAEKANIITTEAANSFRRDGTMPVSEAFSRFGVANLAMSDQGLRGQGLQSWDEVLTNAMSAGEGGLNLSTEASARRSGQAMFLKTSGSAEERRRFLANTGATAATPAGDFAAMMASPEFKAMAGQMAGMTPEEKARYIAQNATGAGISTGGSVGDILAGVSGGATNALAKYGREALDTMDLSMADPATLAREQRNYLSKGAPALWQQAADLYAAGGPNADWVKEKIGGLGADAGGVLSGGINPLLLGSNLGDVFSEVGGFDKGMLRQLAKGGINSDEMGFFEARGATKEGILGQKGVLSNLYKMGGINAGAGKKGVEGILGKIKSAGYEGAEFDEIKKSLEGMLPGGANAGSVSGQVLQAMSVAATIEGTAGGKGGFEGAVDKLASTVTDLEKLLSGPARKRLAGGPEAQDENASYP